MSLPVWPSTVPHLPANGSWRVERRHEPALTTEMNAGTTRARRRYTLAVARLEFDVIMNEAQRNAFHAFYDATIGAGAARFTFPVFDGVRCVNRTARFIDPPSYGQFSAGRVRVSLRLLVEALP